MKISKIKIKNLYGISERELDAGDYELAGTNGVGKSSVIDAVRYALTNKPNREYLIRNGENEGEIIIETDTGLLIDRKARRETTDYKSVKQGGMSISSPEAFLRTIVTPLQLSPVEFMQMDKKRQNAIILDMIQYDWTLDTIREWFGELPDVNYDQNILSVLNDIQAENGTYFQTRQDINRKARQLKAIVADTAESLPVDYDGDEWRDASVSDLYMEIERRRAANASIDEAKRFMSSISSKLRSFEANRDIALAALDREYAAKEKDIIDEMGRLREQYSKLKAEKDGLVEKKADKAAVIKHKYEADAADLEARKSQYEEKAKGEFLQTDDLQKKAQNVEKMKSFVRVWDKMHEQEQEIVELEAESDNLTMKIEKARNLPGEILEECTLPIEGLTVKDGIPLINGLPISNLSDGQKLDLCVDVALANPAGFQIILIDGVEKLSTEMRERLYAKCKAKGIQFISTRTTDDSELIVYEL